MSPALLSKRLKELEKAGIVSVRAATAARVEYSLTPAGEDLRDVVMGLGFWGARWVESQLSLRNLDPSLLMWDMRRNLVLEPLPPTQMHDSVSVPRIAQRQSRISGWWSMEAIVDLCAFDPGFEIDLLVRSPLRTMTAIWMGIAKLRQEIDAGNLELDGDPSIAGAMQQWLGLSPFAKAQPRGLSAAA